MGNVSYNIFIKKLIPLKIRNIRHRFYHKNKYDIVLHKNAIPYNTVFEGKNILRQGAKLIDCYCGFGTTVSENTKLNKAKIGKYSSIGQNVKNSVTMHPSRRFVSTYPGFYLPSDKKISFTNKTLFEKHKYIDDKKKYFIKIGSDVWIGNDVTIFDGVKIGDGAIIGTGAIVTKDVLPFAIVGGIPAKLIRYRFTQEQIIFLQKSKWWEKDISWINKHSNLFTDIQSFIDQLKLIIP